MSNLVHVVIKDHENSGYVWDDFYCLACLDRRVIQHDNLEILRQAIATPQHLSRLYPPLVNEPVCRECGLVFRR
jgi:hypothetical protein